ncbi:hypothetical protein NPIL_553121 [Nephila pilipes]|uniref:Uncharacterized protein n=1 Tax=Nephila pilipes TaxID=299642 RepID=A0A8X6UAA0_NEPPI|nr:hypothetical protein NPIL_553121 [Nephila pilipes]
MRMKLMLHSMVCMACVAWSFWASMLVFPALVHGKHMRGSADAIFHGVLGIERVDFEAEVDAISDKTTSPSGGSESILVVRNSMLGFATRGYIRTSEVKMV